MTKSIKTIILRGVADLSFLVAAVVMFASYQKVVRYQKDEDGEDIIKFIARYIDWNGFMFCAVVDCIACFYNLVVLIIPSGSLLWKTVIFSDVIINILVGASLGAGWQTYTLIIQGNIHSDWSPMCGVAPFFCSKILGSLITSTFGFFLSILLLMFSLHVSVDPFLVDYPY